MRQTLCLPSAFTQERGINCLVRFGFLMLINDASSWTWIGYCLFLLPKERDWALSQKWAQAAILLNSIVLLTIPQQDGCFFGWARRKGIAGPWLCWSSCLLTRKESPKCFLSCRINLNSGEFIGLTSASLPYGRHQHLQKEFTFGEKSITNLLTEIPTNLNFLKEGKHLLLSSFPKHKKSQRWNVLMIHQKTDFSFPYF